MTAGDMLAELIEALERDGISLRFAELKDPTKDRLKRYGLFESLGAHAFFPTVGSAVDGYLAETGIAVTRRLRAEGLQAVGYHAGMAADERASAQHRFMGGDAEVVVATNAFGMGVDKANVLSSSRLWRRVVEEMFRVLRPGGRFVFEQFDVPVAGYVVNRVIPHELLGQNIPEYLRRRISTSPASATPMSASEPGSGRAVASSAVT